MQNYTFPVNPPNYYNIFHPKTRIKPPNLPFEQKFADKSFAYWKKMSNFDTLTKSMKLIDMEEFKKKSAADGDKEIVFSKAIKAGKRIYYLDVKKNRKEEMFLAITESKKIVSGEGDDAQVSFEKHKIFLYKEDFEKFMDGLHQAIQYIESDGNEDLPLPEESNTEEIKIDIDF